MHVRRELRGAAGVPHVPGPEPVGVLMVPGRTGLLHCPGAPVQQGALVLLVYDPQRGQLLAVLFVHASQRPLCRAGHRAQVLAETVGRLHHRVPRRRRTGPVAEPRRLAAHGGHDNRPAAVVHWRVVVVAADDQLPLAPRAIRETWMRQESAVVAGAAQAG